MRLLMLAALAASFSGTALAATDFQTYAYGIVSGGDGYNTDVRPRTSQPADMPTTMDAWITQGGDSVWMNAASTQIPGISYGGSDAWDEYFIPSSGGSTGPATVFSWNTSGNASTSARAELGSLHASAYTQAHINDLTQAIWWTGSDGNSHSVTKYNPYSTGFASVGRAGWRDRFTITSDTLPAGTPVDVRISISMDSNVTNTGSVTTHAGASVFFWGGDNYLVLVQNYGDTPHATDSTYLSTTVGQSFGLEGVMEVSARCSAYADLYGPGVGDSIVMAEAGNTAHFFVESMDPAISVSAISGVSYSVPEPSCLALLGTGMMVLLRRRA